jgi:2-haloacid dehalogenase
VLEVHGVHEVQMNSPIRAFAFDAYGTLFDVYSVTALCEELFPGHGNALAVMWRAKQLQYSLLRSLMHRYKDFWAITLEALTYSAHHLGLDLTAVRRRQLMDGYLTLAAFADVRPGLEALKALDQRLAILSNGSPNMLRGAVGHAGFADLFDLVISVDDIKTFKPSPEVYRLIESRLKIPLPAVGFVSSNSWDVHGAGSAGLTTFWIQRSAAEPSEELGYPAGFVVHTIGELARLTRQERL